MVACLLLVAVLGSACAPPSSSLISEEDDPEFRRGRQYLRQDRKPEALQAFLGVIERRPDAAESHFEVAEIFLTHLNDPISAIYHYQRYKHYRREEALSNRVDQRIETARKAFARTLPGNPLRGELERLELQSTLEQLQAENHQLKREVSELRASLARMGATAMPPAPTATVPTPTPTPATAVTPPQRPVETARPAAPPARNTTYVVQPGDTLFKISTAVYGSGARWREIYEANRDRIPNQNSLRVGTELRIP